MSRLFDEWEAIPEPRYNITPPLVECPVCGAEVSRTNLHEMNGVYLCLLEPDTP